MYDTHTSFVIDTSPALDLPSQPWLNTFDTLTVNPVNNLFIFVLFFFQVVGMSALGGWAKRCTFVQFKHCQEVIVKITVNHSNTPK